MQKEILAIKWNNLVSKENTIIEFMPNNEGNIKKVKPRTKVILLKERYSAWIISDQEFGCS